MQEKKRNTGNVVLMLLDAAVSVAVLVLSLQLIGVYNEIDVDHYDYASKAVVASALFYVLAAEETINWFARHRISRFTSIRYLLGVVLMLASGSLLLSMNGNYFSASFAAISYGVTLALARVEAMRRNRRARSTTTNILSIVMIFLLLGMPLRLFALPLFLLLISFFHIGKVAFSQIDFRRLEKVIRKTYAVEIIFGMLLLIVAFSIVLHKTEPGMETVGDALWYCFAIVTTIGFGDITATGILGRVLSVILGIYGIIVVSLITSVIVNFYNEVKDAPSEDDPPPPPPEGEPDHSNEIEEETP